VWKGRVVSFAGGVETLGLGPERCVRTAAAHHCLYGFEQVKYFIPFRNP
jgi:hypothetical protein